MHKLRSLWARCRGLFSFGRTEDELNAELEDHIAAHTQDGVRVGLTAGEARRQALLRLGGAEQVRQNYRERSTLPWLEHIARDVQYALRGFRRNPAVLAVVALIALLIPARSAMKTDPVSALRWE